MSGFKALHVQRIATSLFQGLVGSIYILTIGERAPSHICMFSPRYRHFWGHSNMKAPKINSILLIGIIIHIS